MTEKKRQEAPAVMPGYSPASREVSWWPTHVFLEALVAQANHLPAAGSPAWCALADGDPAKLLALAVAGEHHVLRIELGQLASSEASKAIAAAIDWGRISNATLAGRGPNYIPRKRAS
ncbi:DUF2742 domain-containing protein [Mycobacterium sp. NPDC050853]|uniref:DUF2742 domain-containing protein n=1 Tax=Mycobacterium sp. NPDC050853 TaxID=3155160 RepID=UPI0033D66AE3